MEWSREYQEPFPFHRHLSHLWGVFPGNLISKERSPEYAQAAEKSLAARGLTTAGWAIAFRGCLQARLRNGDKALTCFQYALKYATAYNLMNLPKINTRPQLPVSAAAGEYPFPYAFTFTIFTSNFAI